MVDHLAQFRVMHQVTQTHPETLPYVMALSARAGIVGAMNALHLVKTGEVTKGQKWQRAANLSSAVFAVASATGNIRATRLMGLAAVGIGIVTAMRHANDLGVPHENGIRKL